MDQKQQRIVNKKGKSPQLMGSGPKVSTVNWYRLKTLSKEEWLPILTNNEVQKELQEIGQNGY